MGYRSRKAEEELKNTIGLVFDNRLRVFKLNRLIIKDKEAADETRKELLGKIHGKCKALKKSGEAVEYVVFEDLIRYVFHYAKKIGSVSVPVVLARGVLKGQHGLVLDHDLKETYYVSRVTSDKRLTPNEFMDSLKAELRLHIEQMRKLYPFGNISFLPDKVMDFLRRARFNPSKIKKMPFAKVQFDLHNPVLHMDGEVKFEEDFLVKVQSESSHFLDEKKKAHDLAKKPKQEKVVKKKKSLVNKEIIGAYELRFDKDLFEVNVLIKNLKPFIEQKNVSDLITKIKEKGKELVDNGEGGNYRMQPREILEQIEEAIGRNDIEVQILGLKGEENEEGVIKLSLSTDKMVLYLTDLVQAKGSIPKIGFENVLAQLTEMSIVEGLPQAEVNVKAAFEMVNNGQKLPPDYIVCRGVKPVHGEDASLDHIYKKAKNKMVKREDGTVDMRARQHSNLVRKGHAFLRVIEATKGVPGTNLLGETIPANDGKQVEVQAGEGVIFSADRNMFISRFDGIPVIEGGTVTINQAYVVEGDLNFKTGDINFDGNLVVTGNVDSGATAEASGDVQVNGFVQNGTVLAGGRVIVDNGIVTGKTGRIRAGMGVQAGFIENSTVRTPGDIVVMESVINSHLQCGGIARCEEGKGIVRGGIIECRALECENLGIHDGNTTEIHAGIDFSYESELKDITAMLEDLENNYGEIRKEIKTVKYDKSIKIGSQDKEEKLEELKRKQEAVEAQLNVMKAKLDTAKENKPVLQPGYVKVNGELSNNVIMKINTKPVPVAKALIGVVFKYKENVKKVEMISVDESTQMDIAAPAGEGEGAEGAAEAPAEGESGE